MIMDFEHIEQLLERYWRCETSCEEEEELRSFFQGENVSAHLLRYKDLFVYQQIQRKISLSEDFDQKVLAEIGTPIVKARHMTLLSRFTPLLKAAAVVTVVLSLSSVVQRSIFNGGEKGVTTLDTISEEISSPSVAQSDENGKQMPDSLECVKTKKKEPLR